MLILKSMSCENRFRKEGTGAVKDQDKSPVWCSDVTVFSVTIQNM